MIEVEGLQQVFSLPDVLVQVDMIGYVAGISDDADARVVVVDVETSDDGFREVDDQIVPVLQLLDAAREVEDQNQIQLRAAC